MIIFWPLLSSPTYKATNRWNVGWLKLSYVTFFLITLEIVPSARWPVFALVSYYYMEDLTGQPGSSSACHSGGTHPEKDGTAPSLCRFSARVCIWFWQRNEAAGHFQRVDSSSSLTLAIKSLFNHIFFCFFWGFFPLPLVKVVHTTLSSLCFHDFIFSCCSQSASMQKNTRTLYFGVWGSFFFLVFGIGSFLNRLFVCLNFPLHSSVDHIRPCCK